MQLHAGHQLTKDGCMLTECSPAAGRRRLHPCGKQNNHRHTPDMFRLTAAGMRGWWYRVSSRSIRMASNSLSHSPRLLLAGPKLPMLAAESVRGFVLLYYSERPLLACGPCQ